MGFAAKSAPPIAAHREFRSPALDQAAEEPLTLFTVPAGYLLTDSLAATLAERGRPVLWLRLGPEDGDPATFLLSLIDAARRLSPEAGAATLDQMQRQLGPTAGWLHLFTHLGRELADCIPANTAIVLENLHHLNSTQPATALLGHYLLPALPASISCILTSQQRLPETALPAHVVRRSRKDLRLDERAALTLARQAEVDLPDKCIWRAMSLTAGRAVALVGLGAASSQMGSRPVQQAVDRATDGDDLLARVARLWLAAADAGNLRALAMALRLEYTDKTLIQAVLGNGSLSLDSWLQPLADGWARMRRTWDAPLRAALHLKRTALDNNALHLAADHLASQSAIEKVVQLYFDLGDHVSAARAIASVTETFLDRGQWQTLTGWLHQLPQAALHAWPWLVYAEGEIAAAEGHARTARRAFAAAARLFTAHHEADGACQSLLAESALAAWQGDPAYARTRALAAISIAKAAGLQWHVGLAAWQVGCLAAAAGELVDALAYFDQGAAAASAAGDPVMVELLRHVEALALRQRDLRRQREHHRQEYFAAERAEHETADLMQGLLDSPSDGLDTLLGTHGWSRTPLMLKLPPPIRRAEPSSIPGQTRPWSGLLGLVGLRERPTKPIAVTIPTGNLPWPGLPPPPLTVATDIRAQLPTVHTAGSSMPVPVAGPFPPVGMPLALPTSDNAVPLVQSAETEPVSLSGPAENSSAQPTLTAHLLGTFRVAVNDRPVENWPKGKGQTLFKYLVTHREPPTPRDVLMDVFWPEASPYSARNRLNVAVHSLRQALRPTTDVSIILFDEGAYRLNPDLRVWLDADEFERHVQAGRQLEDSGQLAAATAEYEVAAGLYQGDFLAEDPYEDWPVLKRERLRSAYLDSLDRLSHIYFSQSQYASCATLCQLILARDNCREDAHCRLMRCYSRQGQHHLALRQYQACVEALRTELDVLPAPATTQLYERIRRREHV